MLNVHMHIMFFSITHLPLHEVQCSIRVLMFHVRHGREKKKDKKKKTTTNQPTHRTLHNCRSEHLDTIPAISIVSSPAATLVLCYSNPWSMSSLTHNTLVHVLTVHLNKCVWIALAQEVSVYLDWVCIAFNPLPPPPPPKRKAKQNKTRQSKKTRQDMFSPHTVSIVYTPFTCI